MTAPNVWKVAKGYTGRRAIVDNNKCKNCHGVLGVSPDVPRRPAQRRSDLLVLPQPEPHQLRLVGRLEVLHPRDPRRAQAHHALHVARDEPDGRLRRRRVPLAAQRLQGLPPAEHLRLHGAGVACGRAQHAAVTTVATGKYDPNSTPTVVLRISPYVDRTTPPTTAPASASTRRTPVSPPRARRHQPRHLARSRRRARPATTRRPRSPT